MKKFIIILLVMTIMISCSSKSGKITSKASYALYETEMSAGSSMNVRARVLESGTITWVKLGITEKYLFRPLDTVWLNLNTHAIDDIDSTTMKVVLLSNH